MRKNDLKEVLKNKVNVDEVEFIPNSFDVIGSRGKAVAVVEIPEELKSKDKLIAETIMEMNKNVKSVLKKVSKRKDVYRLYDYELLAGESNTEVVHKEHGYTIKLDPQKVFFSPRESTERQRVASQVKAGETVCVFFSGVGPYILAICKKQPNVNKVYGVEINPYAHKYALENVRINKISHKVVLINGDVREVCTKIGTFDRVVMPCAIEGWKYLNLAVECLKPNGILHLYYISSEVKQFKDAIEVLEKCVKDSDRKIKILSKKVVGRFGIKLNKICIDAQII
jgi:tRNA (guanine37-N1)-methyltransferase